MPSMLDISPDVAALLAAQASAEGKTVDVYLKSLVEEKERMETIAGVRRGLESMKQGKGIPLEQFDAEFRQRHGFSSTEA